MVCGDQVGASDEAAQVATYDASDVAFLAPLRGRVVVEEGCLLLDAEGNRILPIFPSTDVVWRGGRLTYKGREYRPGDDLEVQGGFVPGEGLENLSMPDPRPSGALTFVVAPGA